MKLTLVILIVFCLYNVRGDYKSEMVELHNKYRKNILSGLEYRQPKAKFMNMLTWDDRLAANAQKLTDSCKYGHNKNENRKIPGFDYVGQNIAMDSEKGTADLIVEAWYEEIVDYKFADGSCSSECGHYTQVVWANTTLIGCGRTVCNTNKVLYACDYAIAANKVGEKPYQEDLEGTREPLTTQAPQKTELTSFEKELFRGHNYYRKLIRDGYYMEQPQAKEMNMLTWNTDLAAEAQRLSDTCIDQADNVPLPRTNFAYWCGTKGHQDSQTVKKWFNEGQFYNYTTNKCTHQYGICFNYIQLVWAETKEVGCGEKRCGEYDIVVCKYSIAAPKKNAPRPYVAADPSARPPPTEAPPPEVKYRDLVYAEGSDDEPSDFQKEMMDYHNEYRKKILLGEDARQPQAAEMPLLTWNYRLAHSAQAQAEACSFSYGTPESRKTSKFTFVNRNMFSRASYAYSPVTDKNAVEDWYSAAGRYDFDSNTCEGNCYSYTQVVSAMTTQIGCGKAKCLANTILIVCDYAEGLPASSLPYTKVADQTTPTAMEKEMLDAHNNYRKGILKGTETRQPLADIMPMLKWSDKLAKMAQDQADTCAPAKDPKSVKSWEFSLIGQNTLQLDADKSNSEVVTTWYNQITNYSYDRNRCTPAGQCNQYLQLVYARSTVVGCGRAACNGKPLVICYYGEGMVPGYVPYFRGTPSTIPPTTVTFNPDTYSKEMLDFHNNLRKAILDGTETKQPKAKQMTMLQWDSELAANAKKLSETCKTVMTTADKRKTSKFSNVGENLISIDVSKSSQVTAAITSWYSTVSWYKYATNSCSMGDGMADPYLQIVWNKATHVGCGTTNCGTKFYTYCHYSEAVKSSEKPYVSV